MASPTPPIIPQSAVINHLVRNEMAKPPKRKIKISDEPEITFDEQGNELLVEDRKQNLIDEALAKSKAVSDTAAKKEELKEIVKQAALNAQKVYEENKGKTTYYTGQLTDEAKKAIAKAQEKLRSSRIYPGGGKMVMLTDKEFLDIVKKHYPRDRK